MTGKNKNTAAEPQAATPDSPEVGPDDNVKPSPHNQQLVDAEGAAPEGDD